MEKFDSFEPERILCPVDFSKLSDLALKYAVKGALEFKAALTVMHAEAFDLPPYLFRDQADKFTQELAAAKQGLESELADHVKKVLKDLTRKLKIEYRVLDRHPAEAILDTAEKTPTDLIVLGTHGYGGLKRFVLGSVAQRVVENALAPVFLVRQKEADFIDVGRPEAVPRLERILCPCNVTGLAETTLRYAVSIVRRFHSKLTVLHVREPYADEDPAKITKQMEALINRNAQDLSVELAVEEGIAAEVIIDKAGKTESDLIILAAHHQPIGHGTFYGRTTDLVVRHAPVPVLVRPLLKQGREEGND